MAHNSDGAIPRSLTVSIPKSETVKAGGGSKAEMLRSSLARKNTTDNVTSDVKETETVCLVIPGAFFVDAAKQSETTPDKLKLIDRHLVTKGGAKSKPANTMAEKSWRRMLVSPLVGFLTDIRNKTEWVQLAGHLGSFLPGRGGTICKKGCEHERTSYEHLMEPGESLKKFVPLYFREIELDAGEKYLELQDLLSKFHNPCVMDVKMGIRTFLESEVSNSKRRMDLLAKMNKLDPDEATSEEKEHGITKLRYMTYREKISSSRSLGFRIEGIKLAGHEPMTEFKTKKSRDEVAAVLTTQFLPQEGLVKYEVRKRLLERLLDLKEHLQVSKFFKEHELIGSSLLFVYDDTGQVGIWMIDFGKTTKVEIPITHVKPWVLGNHEDGYLTGLNTLIEIFS
eukprot:m.336338 g.336338  ORF g.336338 m.336338 type:complete len:396 (-) comp17819_c0_seq1:100-1287(-)